MLIKPKHIDDMIQQQKRSRRAMLYVAAAAPVFMYLFMIFGLSSDRIRVLLNRLDVVQATVVESADEGNIRVTYPCERRMLTASIPVSKLAGQSSYTEQKFLQKYGPGSTFQVGLDSDCKIEMAPVSFPPFLLYLGVTIFMGFITVVWTAFIYGILQAQGHMLEGVRGYFPK